MKPREQRLPDEAGIDQIVHGFMRGAIDGSSQGYRKPEFRASAFPYCPILMALGTPLNEETYTSDFYFKTGTAIHELLQKWGSNTSADLFGDWRCTGCGAKRALCTRPGRCNVCGSSKDPGQYRWEYTEVAIKWRGLSGHVDCILQVTVNGRDYYVLGDWKTTLFKFNGGPADRAKFPYRTNVMQISVYATLLWEVFGLDVIGWSLIYVDRSRPLRGPRDYHVCSHAWTQSDHDRWLRILKWADRTNVPAERILNARMAGNDYDPEDLWDVVTRRPCRSEARWRSWMKPRFKYDGKPGQDGECPHLDTCLNCSNEQVEEYFSDIIAGCAST